MCAYIWEARVAQWWDRSPPTSVAQVRFRTQRYRWAEFACWFSPCSETFLLGYSSFPLSSKTNISKFKFDSESEHHRFCQSQDCQVVPLLNKVDWLIDWLIYLFIHSFGLPSNLVYFAFATDMIVVLSHGKIREVNVIYILTVTATTLKHLNSPNSMHFIMHL